MGVIPIVCAGPGPHVPADGVLGTADRQVTGMLCPSPACQAVSLAASAAAAAADTNRVTLQSRAQAALTANANFLALASPTNAQMVTFAQTTAKELNALIRLVLSQLDSISGT